MKKGLRFTPLFLLLALEVVTANALPDLQVTEANHFASGCLNRGQSYDGSGVIKNVGDINAPAFRVLVRMYGVDDYFDVPSLSPGEEKTFDVERLLPSDAPCQRYGIRVIVDVDNAVEENSEGEDNAKNGISLYPCDCPGANPSSTPTATSAPATPTATEVPITETPTATVTEVGPSPSPTHSATTIPTPTNTPVPATGTPTQTASVIPPTATPTVPSCDACDLIIASVTHEEISGNGDILFSIRIENPCGSQVTLQHTQYMCVVLGGVDFLYMDPPVPAGTTIPAGGAYLLESIAQQWLFPTGCTELHVCFCSIPCIDAVTHTVCVEDSSPTPTNTPVPATGTPTPTRTHTNVPPSVTPTQTNTSIPSTATPTQSATQSSTPTSTATEVVATETPSPSPTHTSVEATATETPGLADIVITTAEHAVESTCLTRGEECTGRVVIKNTGGKPSGNFSTTIIMYGVSEMVMSDLDPNEEQEFLVVRTLPLDAPCQLYGIRVIVDINNTVEEVDEEQNAKNGIPLYPCGCQETPTPTETTVPPSPTPTSTEPEPTATATVPAEGPDLIVTHIELLEESDTLVTLLLCVKNVGDASAVSNDHRFALIYMGERTLLDPAHPLVLGPTEGECGEFTFPRTTLPANGGEVLVTVEADALGLIPEADELNNTLEGVLSLQGETPTATPTSIPEGCDSGYYVMDVYGSRHRVGNPPLISGGLFFGDNVARDMERAQVDSTTEDLVILDSFGASHFVSTMREIPQAFYFPAGRAVDMQMSRDSAGMWILTDYGRIYKAGSALDEDDKVELVVPAIDGMLGWDIPTPNVHLDIPPSNARGATLRAVSLVALDITGSPAAEGYLIFDSQGGCYQIQPNGEMVVPGTYADVPQNHPYRLLDPGVYLFPFFAGLDILRDVELHPSKEGLVVFDGWGGIHPVPVEDPTNPVFYTRNEDPENLGTLITTVGMPYITEGFDDPATPGFDESIGIDSGSIYVDFEFSDGCPGSGFWTLDSFGGVFVFGEIRKDPTDISSPFEGTPYFFPSKLAKKLAIFK